MIHYCKLGGLLLTFPISKKYRFELSAFGKLRNFKSSFSPFNISLEFNYGKWDHCPNMDFMIEFFNFKIIEIGYYNIKHKESENDTR
jgi:hypothetical protein